MQKTFLNLSIMIAQIDRSARLRENIIEVFGVVPKNKVSYLDGMCDCITTHSPFGDINVIFFKNHRGILMYRAFANVSGNTTIFELKGWASAIRSTMKLRFNQL